MIQRCIDCVYYRDIEKWEYTERGVEHTKVDGYGCLVFSDDVGKVIWMVGNPQADTVCECFEFCKKVGVDE